MRIWDIDPGFLNDQSLLGEHRELHGMFNIITMNKKGYSKHPETLRWVNHIKGLFLRHQLLVCEMNLRGFNHKSPLDNEFGIVADKEIWPSTFIDQPSRQFSLLKEKYKNKKQGRIPLTTNPQELWARHKYSVMARSYNDYKRVGKAVANKDINFTDLSSLLVKSLRSKPSRKAMTNSISHMWGYASYLSDKRLKDYKLKEIFSEIQQKVFEHKIEYILFSTALGELDYWLNHPD